MMYTVNFHVHLVYLKVVTNLGGLLRLLIHLKRSAEVDSLIVRAKGDFTFRANLEGRNIDVSCSQSICGARIDTKNLKNQSNSSRELISLVRHLNSTSRKLTIITNQILIVIVTKRKSHNTCGIVINESSCRCGRTRLECFTKSTVGLHTINLRGTSYICKSNSCSLACFRNKDTRSSDLAVCGCLDLTRSSFLTKDVKINEGVSCGELTGFCSPEPLNKVSVFVSDIIALSRDVDSGLLKLGQSIENVTLKIFSGSNLNSVNN